MGAGRRRVGNRSGHISNGELLLSLEDVLKLSNLTLDKANGKVNGNGLSVPIDRQTKDQLEILLIKLLGDIEDSIHDQKLLNQLKISSQNSVDELVASNEAEDGVVIDDGEGSDKEGDTSKPEEVVVTVTSEETDLKADVDDKITDNNKDNTETNMDKTNTNTNNDDDDDDNDENDNKDDEHIVNRKRDRSADVINGSEEEDDDDDDDDESTTRTRKKSKIKIENDEDEDYEVAAVENNEVKSDNTAIEIKEESVTEHDNDKINNTDEIKPEPQESDKSSKKDPSNDVPSIYDSIPEPNFDMHHLVETMSKVLELYDEEKNKTTAKDFAEYWRRKCAVSHYPSTDLKDELPGEIPMTDFSGPKPGNQISFTTFMGYVEGFFRNFNEDDLRWLRQKTIHSTRLCSAVNAPEIGPDGNKILTGNVQPYDPKKDPQYIPPLGPSYHDVWQAESEGKQIRLSKLQANNGLRIKKQLCIPIGDSGAIANSCDDNGTKVSAGPLTSRLLSALVPDDEVITKDFFSKEDNIEEMMNPGGLTFDQIEEKLKRELNYVGVFLNVRQKLKDDSWDQDWGIFKEDDEISREIRKLQKELKETQARNNARKNVLIPKVKEQIAWQEYMMIVEDLDKQVEQHYRRRLGVIPKKNAKKKVNDEKEDNTHLITNASFIGLLEKRKRWIEKIGPLFKSNIEMRHMPEEPIFKEALDELEKESEGLGEEGDEEGDEADQGSGDDEVNADQL